MLIGCILRKASIHFGCGCSYRSISSTPLKMMNFVVWFWVGIKLFKLWYERKQAALQAELSALKGQVHPHFLSIHSIIYMHLR